MAMAAPPPAYAGVLLLLLFLALAAGGASGTSFNFVNSCNFTVWVGAQPNGGIPLLVDGGFTLDSGASNAVSAPVAWGGRFWGRTGCKFDSTGKGTCETGDCGGVLKCEGAGGNPPASLAEFTLNGANGDDFYDISLVDGYNLPLQIKPTGGNGTCGSPGCTSNLNNNCPTALQVQSGGVVIACKSACAAFNTPQYCCTGAYGSPSTCPPTTYSKTFKAACPTAYSYAYDDATSTFTCAGATSYAIVFCPTGSGGSVSSTVSGAASSPPPPPSTTITQITNYSGARRLLVTSVLIVLTSLPGIATFFLSQCKHRQRQPPTHQLN